MATKTTYLCFQCKHQKVVWATDPTALPVVVKCEWCHHEAVRMQREKYLTPEALEPAAPLDLSLKNELVRS